MASHFAFRSGSFRSSLFHLWINRFCPQRALDDLQNGLSHESRDDRRQSGPYILVLNGQGLIEDKIVWKSLESSELPDGEEIFANCRIQLAQRESGQRDPLIRSFSAHLPGCVQGLGSQDKSTSSSVSQARGTLQDNADPSPVWWL